jgi:pimeloyl-ACP methyl ester carboxylesterase
MMRLNTVAAEAAQPSRKATYHETVGPIPRRFFLYRPSTAQTGAPLIVSVHGIARNAAAHAYRLAEEAERYGVTVMAPLFDKESYGQYQQLLDKKSGARSDIALLDAMEAAARLSGASVDRVVLFGYSGGAQFAHRFVMAHPHRVASVLVVAAGWYTFPDDERAYPHGLKLQSAFGCLNLDPVDAARVPHHVLIGELDIVRDSSLRQSRRLDAQQGSTRLSRAYRWREAMREFAARAGGRAPTMTLLPGVGHSFLDSVERADLPRLLFEKAAKDAGLRTFF